MLKRVVGLVLMGWLALALTGAAQQLAPPVKGKAKVYVFCFGHGSRAEPMMFVGNRYVGELQTDGYMELDLDPGKHVLWAFRHARKTFAKLDVAEGKTYYLHLATVGRPVPQVQLVNASQNNRRAARQYKFVADRLAKNAFTAVVNSPEKIATGQAANAQMIQEVMAKWEGGWNKSREWAVVVPEDGT
jgi:hypothetical protein